jgi:hypothetical protein
LTWKVGKNIVCSVLTKTNEKKTNDDAEKKFTPPLEEVRKDRVSEKPGPNIIKLFVVY